MNLGLPESPRLVPGFTPDMCFGSDLGHTAGVSQWAREGGAPEEAQLLELSLWWLVPTTGMLWGQG